MSTNELSRCRRCGLPATFPGTIFDESGTCNYCASHDLLSQRDARQRSELKRVFLETIEAHRGTHPRYDAVLMYSGGKDSTYLLQRLKREFGLRILAHTFDNGFLASGTWENTRRVLPRLDVDLRVTRPPMDLMVRVFRSLVEQDSPNPPELLAMASPICHACIGMVIGSTLNIAVQERIPIVFSGMTPGQYPSVTLENFAKLGSCVHLTDVVSGDDPADMLKILSDPILERFGEDVAPYYFRSQYVEPGTFIPKVLFPYHALFDYDERVIYTALHELGWVRPKGVDACTTNCTINSLGILQCLRQHGFHPYIGEMAHMVRQGQMSREAALSNEALDEESPAVQSSRRTLGVRLPDVP